MIDEAIGKILGMAMAYGVSSMGLFLAYANYRKRTLKADKIMTPTAWMVVGVTLLAVVGAVLLVAQLAQAPASADAEQVVEAAAEQPIAEHGAESVAEPVAEPVVESIAAAVDETSVGETVAGDTAGAEPQVPRDEWPWVGIVVPATIFLLATWLTAGLHRRFSHGDS